MIRAHNDANTLCVGQRILGIELAKAIVQAFTSTDFEGGRHQRRVDKMMRAGGGG
jgi:ribose 5-phosphate isomerase B